SGAEADDRAGRATAVEHDERRQREHVVPRRDLREVVGVHARELDAARELPLELLEDRLERAARPAPGRPEVDGDGSGADRLVEGGGVEVPHYRIRPVSAATRSA